MEDLDDGSLLFDIRILNEFQGKGIGQYYRKSWPAENSILKDTVRNSILRSDWQSGKQTPVNWAE